MIRVSSVFWLVLLTAFPADAILGGASASRERFVNGTSHRVTRMAIKLVSKDKHILWTEETRSVIGYGQMTLTRRS